jgi:hypothetical protein
MGSLRLLARHTFDLQYEASALRAVNLLRELFLPGKDNIYGLNFK